MSTETCEVQDRQVQPVLDALHLLTGITIPVQKKTMVLFRLRKRLAELDHPALAEYIADLERNKKEQQIFINLLTTNETQFFRTRRVWQFFAEELLPQFYAEYGSVPLKVWSAAASTGEEACSIAMTCLEFQRSHGNFRFQILATDIDTKVIASAESGRFREVTANRLKQSSPALFQRHFRPAEDGEYQVNPETMRCIRFAPHNLMLAPGALMPQHVVFLRNVLIYFEEREQIRIIRNIADGMDPGATLILGESESLHPSFSDFSFVKPQIYRRNG